MKKIHKITWVNFLHIYQPPWQQPGVIQQVASESYEYLITLLETHKNFQATINITGKLVEQLEEQRPDLLLRIKKLVSKGKIELTGSAKYHALLPLLPKAEVKRQIELNKEVLKKHFPITKIEGFYFPEMSFSNQAAKIVKEQGYKWIILDPINYQSKVDNNFIYTINKIGLKVVFRNREISKSYPAEVIYNKLKNLSDDETIITGTDGEMYGHFHEDWQGHLEKVIQSKDVSILTVKKYLSSLSKKKSISLRTASWETTEEEIKKGVPFSLWHDPKNNIHNLLWEIVEEAYKLLNKHKKDKNYKWARNHLDRGLSSCTFWWASGKKLSIFSPLTWNPDMIDNGSEELIKVSRSLDSASEKDKIKMEKLYINIKKTTWLTHWVKYNDKQDV